jgi:hypothetical protein
MIDLTKVQLNPIPPPILELQKQNVILEGKNRKIEKIIIGGVMIGMIVLIFYTIKDANARNEK